MHKRWAAFTIVELIVIIAVIGLIATIATIGFTLFQRSAAEQGVVSSLSQAEAYLQRYYQDNGEYPQDLPETILTPRGVNLEITDNDQLDVYENISPVQNGVLLAESCQQLIDEGVGRGVNQGGQTQNYITGCGNWNNNSMQITGWNSRTYQTPVAKETLLAYADSFTTNDLWNKVHETVVKNFHYSLIERHEAQGGYFPVTTFWDSWATPQNGGVIRQELPPGSPVQFYCVNATHSDFNDLIWHIRSTGLIRPGSC